MQALSRTVGRLASVLRFPASANGPITLAPTTFDTGLLRSPVPSVASTYQQVRGVKDKHVLKLRCSNCHFKKIDQRWWVWCDAFPRHKQRERVDDQRARWIVTHVTRGGRPFQKKSEAYVCNTAPPGPYDYKPKIWSEVQPGFPKLKMPDYYA